MEQWRKRKDGRSYKKKSKKITGLTTTEKEQYIIKNKKRIKLKPLKIIINDVHDQRFLNSMNKAISDTPKSIEHRINSVKLSMRKGNEPVGQSVMRTDGKYDIKINFEVKNRDSYPLVFRHEMDHIYFDEVSVTKPKKVRRYIDDISGLMPFNDKLQEYFKDYQTALKTKEKKKIIPALILYAEEFHSETHEAWGRIKLGLDPFKVDKATKQDLKKALIAYNKFHKE